MGGLKNAPEVPDPVQIAGYQTGTNIGTAKANARFGYVGQTTPYGSTILKHKGTTKYVDPYTGEKYKIPRFTEKVKLTPEGKEMFNLQQGTQKNLLALGNKLSGQMGDYLSQPFSLGQFDFGADLGVDAYQPGQSLDGEAWSGDPLKLGNEATEARLFELGSKRLDPKFEQDQKALQANLLARGVREGTAAWDAAMGNFNQGKNDAYNELLLSGRGQAANELMAEWQSGLTGNAQRFGQLVQSRGLGMQEQGQQFSQTLADRQRLLSERAQETGEAFATRSQPINEIAALLGTGGQVQMPDLKGYNTTQIPTMDVAGLINNNWEQQFKAWQAESAATQGLLGGMFGAVGNIFASDERIKEKGDVVGTTAEGLPIYEFKVGDGETQTGVMAQDVEQMDPGAVIDTPAGIKAVDYAQAVGSGDGTYTVEKGDNLWKIGQRFGVGVPDIVAANPQIRNPDRIMPGDQITVPGLAAPGPEAIPYDPLSSAFQPPADGSGLPAVIEALQPEAQSIMADAVFTPPSLEPWEMDAVRQFDAARRGGPVPQANDIGTMTQVDNAGAYLLPPNVGGARPELPASPMPGAPGMSAAMGNAPPIQLPPRIDPAAQDARMADFEAGMESDRIARDLYTRRREMQQYVPDYRTGPAPQRQPEPVIGTVEAGSTGGEFFSPPPPQPQVPGSAGEVFGLGQMNGIGFPEPEPRIGTAAAGSTTGEFFSPPPPGVSLPEPGVDPNAYRFPDTFDTPAGRAEIMDLLAAFQQRQMLNPMGGIMRAGIGGF